MNFRDFDGSKTKVKQRSLRDEKGGFVIGIHQVSLQIVNMGVMAAFIASDAQTTNALLRVLAAVHLFLFPHVFHHAVYFMTQIGRESFH